MAAKKVFVALDGLRGIAAFGVLFLHLGSWTDATRFVHRGDLAVDFFFCLSGFVMAHAYGDKLRGGMSRSRFVAIRMIRLYPLIAFSILIAAAYFIAKDLTQSDATPTVEVLQSALLGLLLIPSFDEANTMAVIGASYPINGPIWSLFFELAANFAWVLIFPLLTFQRTVASAIVAGVILIAAGLHFGGLLLGAEIVGFFGGIPRVWFSFALGLIAYELHRAGRNPVHAPYWTLAAGLAVIFLIPRPENGLFIDAVFVFLLSPLIVMAGANLDPKGRVGGVSEWAGELSYPLYVLHFPLYAWLNGALQTAGVEPGAWSLNLLIAAAIIAGSQIILIIFDRPARRFLTKGMRARPPGSREAAAAE